MVVELQKNTQIQIQLDLLVLTVYKSIGFRSNSGCTDR